MGLEVERRTRGEDRDTHAAEQKLSTAAKYHLVRTEIRQEASGARAASLGLGCLCHQSPNPNPDPET